MSKRVHEIAKERGLPPKEVLQRLQAAGLKVKAVSSSVDEADARRVLGDGNGAAQSQASAPAGAPGREQPRRDGAGERSQPAGGESRPDRGSSRPKARPVRPRASRPSPGRVRAQAQPQPEPQSQPSGRRPPARRSDGPAGESGQPQAPDARLAPGRARSGQRRRPAARGDRLASFAPDHRRAPGPDQPAAAPAAPRTPAARVSTTKRPSPRPSQTALAEPDAIRINSGSTVKDVAEYLRRPGARDHEEADGAGRDEDAHPDAVRRHDRGAGGRARQGQSRSSTPRTRSSPSRCSTTPRRSSSSARPW